MHRALSDAGALPYVDLLAERFGNPISQQENDLAHLTPNRAVCDMKYRLAQSRLGQWLQAQRGTSGKPVRTVSDRVPFKLVERDEMKRLNLSRREFHRLTMAAFGGMVAGSTIGCGGDEAGDGGEAGGEPAGGEPETAEATPASSEGTEEVVLNACRGLNVCKGHGKGEHDCAGQGSCATAEPHDCSGLNNCKNQGGCGANPGANACKGQGGCAVPMKGEMWEKARAAFEERMKEAGKEFGEPPEA